MLYKVVLVFLIYQHKSAMGNTANSHWLSGRSPGGGNGNSLQYSCQKIPWRKSLAGHSTKGLKESDRTEQLNTEHIYFTWNNIYMKTISFLSVSLPDL